jgi:tRNA(His) 5'-end guanylyltransferase
MQIFKAIENMYKVYLNNLYNYIFDYLYNKVPLISEDDEIKTRMSKYIDINNKKCHPYKPFVVSLKSRQILSYFNNLTNIDDKLKFIDNFNEIMIEVSKKLYMQYDPRMIYTFHDEIHLVFFYNENGNYMYSGDINKIITTLVSYTSIELTKILTKRSIDLDFIYKGQFVEFDEDYEILNYIIWRQLDCKRNIITLLYKCINLENFLNNKDKNNCLKLNTMEKYVSDFLKNKFKRYYTGNILKKTIYYTNKTNPKIVLNKKDDDYNNLTIRKKIDVENFYFSDNFKENFNIYIKNKIM